MPLTTETKVVARCDDGCAAVRFGTDALPPVGLYGTVEQVYEDADGSVRSRTVSVYATSLPHLKRAVEEKFEEGLTPDHRNYSEGAERPEHKDAGQHAEEAPAA